MELSDQTVVNEPEDWHVESIERALRTTRSVRRRIDFDRPVEREVLGACIDTAVQAPTGAPNERWRFVVVEDRERKRRLADLYRSALASYRERLAVAAAADPDSPEAQRQIRPTQNALAERLEDFPVLIVVCMEGRIDEGAPLSQQVGFLGSVLPAAWSLMVALRSRGLGSTWTSLHLLHEEEAAEVLGVPADVTQTVLLPVGYMKGALLREADRKGWREVTFWNEWGCLME